MKEQKRNNRTMSQTRSREAQSERVVLNVTPTFKRRLYSEAARRGLTVSDISRSAINAALNDSSVVA